MLNNEPNPVASGPVNIVEGMTPHTHTFLSLFLEFFFKIFCFFISQSWVDAGFQNRVSQ